MKTGEDPFPAAIYQLKVNNKNTRTRCEMFKVNNWCRSGVFIVNFE